MSFACAVAVPGLVSAYFIEPVFLFHQRLVPLVLAHRRPSVTIIGHS